MKGEDSVATQSINILQTLGDLAKTSGIAKFIADPLALIMVGIACFLIYRFFRILVLRLLIRLGRWGNK